MARQKPPSDEERIRDHEQCISPLLDHDSKSCLKIRFSRGRQRLEAYPENVSRRLRPQRIGTGVLIVGI